MRCLIENINGQREEVQKGKLWVGGSFNSKLSQVDENLAFVRPVRDLNSVAEIISNLTLWKKETLLKIKTGKGSKTEDPEENWLSNEKLKNLGWYRIRAE